MVRDIDIVPVTLISGKMRFEVDAKYGSRYSLLIRTDGNTNLGDVEVFDDLQLLINEEHVSLGPCRMLLNDGKSDFDRRLVGHPEVFDIHDLFYKQRRSVLQGGFLNLDIVLGHKERIKQEFKDYTADLTYCLSVYQHLFDSIDKAHQDEPEAVQGAIQQTVMENEGAHFVAYFEQRLRELEKLVATYTHKEHERHGYYFRRQVWNHILASAIMKRTNLKPRGYAGDSEMMKMIYRQDDLGDSIYSRLMHKHPIEHAAAQAVRNRRVLIADTLKETQKGSALPPDTPLKVLSVACGPAFELGDLLKTAEDCHQYEFTLMDQDPDALEEASLRVAQLEKNIGAKIKAEILQESVRTMMRTRKLAQKWGQFHFIYSMGLFDYLIQPVAKAVFRNLFGLLHVGGELIIGNFHVNNPSKIYMEYWNDWVLYYRSEEDILDLLQGLSGVKHSITFEDTGCQMFLKVKKFQS